MWSEISVVIVIPIIRGLIGWAKKSLKDNKINRYEWKKGLYTVLKIGLIGACELGIARGFFSMPHATVEIMVVGAASLITNELFDVMKENKNKRR